MSSDNGEKINEILFKDVRKGLKAFCLERWQSLHENYARFNLSESGVFPLKLHELELLGLKIEDLKEMSLGYGWTRGSPELREKISELYGGEAGKDEVLVTAGSAEANFILAMSIVREGDLVFVDVPNYMQMPGLLPFFGARVKELRRSPPSWKFPTEKAVKMIEEEKPKAVFICNPNNPTGQVISEKELEELEAVARRVGTILVFDEVYWGSEIENDRPSVLEMLGKDAVVSVSGLSKVYGMPGLRIGWIAGKKEIVEMAWSIKDYTSIAPSVLSDRIASAVLSAETVRALRERARRIVKKNYEIFASTIPRDLLDPLPPQAGAFVWARVPWENNTLALSMMLFSSRGILVNPGECFGEPGFLRIGLGQESSEFSNSLAELAKGLKEEKKIRL